MSEPITAETEVAGASATEKVAPTEQVEVDYKAEADKWKALSRENEAKAKANAEKAKSFDALEEDNKTEQQRLAERAEKAETALATKQLEADRALVALDKGLTAKQASRLVGATREELLADADQLLEDLGTQPSPNPRSDPSQGVKGRIGAATPAEELGEILRSKLAGR